MSLSLTPFENNYRQSAWKIIADFLNHPEQDKEFLNNMSLEDLSLSVFYPVYHLGIDGLTHDEPWKYTEIIAYEALCFHGEKVVAAVRLEANSEKKPSGLRFGDILEKTVKAIQIAEKHSDLKNDDYQLRLLNIPRLYIQALWLKNDKKDFILPFHNKAPVENFTLYTVTEFCSRLESNVKDIKNFIESGNY